MLTPSKPPLNFTSFAITACKFLSYIVSGYITAPLLPEKSVPAMKTPSNGPINSTPSAITELKHLQKTV